MVSGTVAEMLARAVWTLIETIDIVLVESTDTGWVVPRFRQPGGKLLESALDPCCASALILEQEGTMH